MSTNWYDPPPAPIVNGLPVCIECLRPLVGREERVCEACGSVGAKYATPEDRRHHIKQALHELENDRDEIDKQIHDLKDELEMINKGGVPV